MRLRRVGQGGRGRARAPALRVGGAALSSRRFPKGDDVTDAHQAAAFGHRDILTVFSGIAVAMLMAAMDQTIVATALPTIAGQLGGLEQMSWVVSAYLVASTVTTPVFGKLSDQYGRKRLLQATILFFLAGSMMCGAAQSMPQLIAARAVQGMGGGALMALAFTIIGDIVPPRERGRYAGYIASVFALSSVAGPVLGGVLTEQLSWRWIFYINLPLGAAALLMTRRALGRLRVHHGRKHIDYAGAALLIVAVTALLLALSWAGRVLPWTSPVILLLLAGAGAGIVAFWARERTAPEPILPPRLFQSRVFAVSGPLIVLAAMVLFASVIYVPVHLQLVQGRGAGASGLLLLPLTVGLTSGATGGGRLIGVYGRYKIFPVLGMALAALVLASLSLADGLGQLGSSALLFVLGIGLGFIMPVLTVAVQNDVERRDLGAATASLGFFRSLGGALGVAVYGSILTRLVAERLHGTPADGVGVDVRAVLDRGPEVIATLPPAARQAVTGAFAHAFDVVFLLAAGTALLAMAVALLLREVPLRTTLKDGGGGAEED